MKTTVVAFILTCMVILGQTNSETNQIPRRMTLLENRESNCLVRVYFPAPTPSQIVLVIMRNAPKTLWKDTVDFSRENQILDRGDSSLLVLENAAKGAAQRAERASIKNEIIVESRGYGTLGNTPEEVESGRRNEQLARARQLQNDAGVRLYLARQQAEKMPERHHPIEVLAKYTGQMDHGRPIWTVVKSLSISQ